MYKYQDKMMMRADILVNVLFNSRLFQYSASTSQRGVLKSVEVIEADLVEAIGNGH